MLIKQCYYRRREARKEDHHGKSTIAVPQRRFPVSISKNTSRDQKASTGQQSKAKKMYEAFDTKGRSSPFLEIRCVLTPSQAPQFRYLMDVVYSTGGDDGFTLIYSFMAAEIKGVHLKDMRRAIRLGACEFIQEWHENEFALLQRGEPMITSVTCTTGEKLDALLSSYL